MYLYVRNNGVREAFNYISKVILGKIIFSPEIPVDNKILFYWRDRKEFGFYLISF